MTEADPQWPSLFEIHQGIVREEGDMRRVLMALIGIVALIVSATAPGTAVAAPPHPDNECPAGYTVIPTPDKKGSQVDRDGDGQICAKTDQKAKGPAFVDF
jgi:hypothetical protein